MKKKLTKAIAILMCVIIACMSMSVSVFAANKDVYTIDQLEGYAVTFVETNKSETRAFLELGYGYDYATTTNGKDYTIFNFNEYLPAGCEEITVYDHFVKDDLFCLLLRAYRSEWVTDGYDEWLSSVCEEQMILTTTDFKSFTKHSLDLNVDINDYAYFDVIGDTFFYGTREYRESGRKAYFSGVYYTTKDFVNWTKHQTPELQAVDLYQDVYYSVAGNALCIELYTADEDRYTSSKVYATQDFNNYTTVFGGFKKDEVTSPFFCATPVNGKILRFNDVYSSKHDTYLRSEIALVDVKTGEEKIMLEDSLNYWEYYCSDNNFCLIYEREEGDPAEIFMYNERAMKFETEKTDYSVWDVYFEGYLGDAIFFQKGDSICVSPSGNPAHYNEYDISDLGVTDADLGIIRLNGDIFVLATIWNEHKDIEQVKAAKLDISLQKNGDLNNDGVINSTDALAVLMSTVDKKTLTEAEKAVADTTKDGAINSTDALMILQYAVGKRLGI